MQFYLQSESANKGMLKIYSSIYIVSFFVFFRLRCKQRCIWNGPWNTIFEELNTEVGSNPIYQFVSGANRLMCPTGFWSSPCRHRFVINGVGLFSPAQLNNAEAAQLHQPSTAFFDLSHCTTHANPDIFVLAHSCIPNAWILHAAQENARVMESRSTRWRH